MTLFFADLVREFSSSTGAGDFVLAGAVSGHRRFAAAVPAGARFHYCIAGVTRPDQWEVGEGEIGSGGTLVRSPGSSSAGGGLVAFAAGLKTVALTVAADWFAAQEAGRTVGIGDVTGLPAALDGKLDAGAASGFGRSLIDDANAAAARATLGLGSLATQAAGNVAISGGSVAGLASLGTAGSAAFGGAATSYRLTVHGAGNGAGFYLNVPGASAAQPAMAWVDGAVDMIGGPSASAGYGFLGTYSAHDFVFLRGQAERARVTGSGLSVTGQCSASVQFNVGGTKVVGSRAGGWAAPSGTASRSGFDTAGVTTAQLAERVKALIDDLTAHGLIGS